MTDENTYRATSERRTLLRSIAAGGLGVGATILGSGTSLAAPSERREIIRITGGGDDLGPDREEGHFYYDHASGDFDVAVRCTDLEGSTGWEKAGIMVRESLDPQAAHLMVRRNPDGEDVYGASPASIQWRSEYGVQNQATSRIAAEWLRLRREDSTLEILGSMTGSNWRRFGEFSADEVELGEDVVVGLAVTSIEWIAEPTVTATFTALSGLDPAAGVDLGDPDHPGDVTVRDDVPVVDTLEPHLGPRSITLEGAIFLPENVSSADCYFQYRRNDEDDWTTTPPRTLTSSGRFGETVRASSRTIYQVRALADVPDAPSLPGAAPTEGPTVFRSTPSRAHSGRSESNRQRTLSAGVSKFGPGDGFAHAAPWLDDDTPIVRVTEPTVEALEDAFQTPVERLVVFETSGVIDLEGSELSITTDRCYVAGQTAPSPGITFVNGELQIAADDCVLQHVRVRPGDYEKEPGWAPTAIHVQDERENNIVDHCTTTWAIDENLTIGGDTRNTTYSNNLVAEALRDSTHPKNEHSMGSLINPGAERVALLGNVWAHNVDRNPRLRLGSRSVVVNNLIYNFDDGCWMDPQARASIVGNGYLRPRTDEPIVVSKSLDYGEGIPKAYLEDNYTDGDVPMHSSEGFERLDARPLWPDGLEAFPSGEVLDHNLANAGARPADRTAHDERIVALIANDDGDWIDSQDEVGGYPDLPVNTRSLDVPQSGVREWLRDQSRRVESPSRY